MVGQSQNLEMEGRERKTVQEIESSRFGKLCNNHGDHYMLPSFVSEIATPESPVERRGHNADP